MAEPEQGDEQPTDPSPRRGRRRRWWVIGSVGLVLLLAAGAGAYLWLRPTTTPATERTVTMTVSTQTFTTSVGATGTIEPGSTADVDFAVSGTVTAVKVKAGQKVTKGQTLATIDDTVLSQEVTAATLTVQAAQLVRDDATTDQAIAQADALLTSAKTKLSQAEDNLAAATLTSPISGTIASMDLAVGDEVSGSSSSGGSSGGSAGGSGSGAGSGSGTTSSSSQFVIVDTSSWTVSTSVTASDLAKLKTGLQAQITPTGATEQVFGTVSEIGIIASTSSGSTPSFPVTIKVTGSPTGLYAGSGAAVTIIVSKKADVLVVPTQAIRTESGKTVVSKLVSGKATTTEITVGTVQGQYTEVTQGLSEGDQVQVTTASRAGGNAAAPSGNRSGGSGQGGQGGQGEPPSDLGGMGGQMPQGQGTNR